MAVFKNIEHSVDFCVVGGGLAGLCAAIAASRNELRVALMQDRPMLGGNASSEIRMWVCGAHGANNRETGILEEIMLENYYRNPYKNYTIWDNIMYEKARAEKNIELILNCSCLDAQMDGSKILSVKGWQTTTQTYHTVSAGYFADCSGDSILAPLTGAEFRVGRESSAEFNEDIAPEFADKKTMGMSCLIQARECEVKRSFIPPSFAEKYSKEDLPYRRPNIQNPGENFWYLELGGEVDSIADTEVLRDELQSIAYGMWDYVKNSGEYDSSYDNYDIDWIGMLPGKRESRRYVGDHILTQHDVRAEGRFNDIAAYGGWSMDDHHPAGFRTKEPPTIYHPAPSPFGIPYRCLYSKNIDNLFFAGRNISLTHAAMSSCRVMATCAMVGQAVGTAAAVASKNNTSPRGVYQNHISQLQHTLMLQDCYLPFTKRILSDSTLTAGLSDSQAEVVRNGHDRPLGEESNMYTMPLGKKLGYAVQSGKVCGVRIVWDSDLNRTTQPEGNPGLYTRPMYATYYRNIEPTHVPATMVRDYDICVTYADGSGKTIEVRNNYQRLNMIDIPCGEVKEAALIPLKTWGADEARIFSYELV